MRIAFTSTSPYMDSKIDPRFGRASYIVILNENTQEITSLDNRQAINELHGSGPALVQKIYELKPDVIITGNGPGENAAKALQRLNLKVYANAHDLTLEEAYKRYKEGHLKQLL